MAMQTVQWRTALRTGDTAFCRGHIVTLVERVTPNDWKVTGGSLPGVWTAQGHELQPVPGKAYAANEGRDPRLCYPDGKPGRVGDLVRVTVAGHKAGQTACEVETLYGFGQIGLKQRTATHTHTYTVSGQMLEFVGRKSEGELPPVDDGAQPLPDVDADLEPVTEFRTVAKAAPVADETFARSREERPALWKMQTPPREVSVEEMQAAEAALADARAKRETAEPHRHSMLDVIDQISAEVAAEEAAEEAVYKSGEPARRGDVVQHYRPGCVGTVVAVSGVFVAVEWHEWDGKAQTPPFDGAGVQQKARDFTLVHREENEHVEAAEAAPVVVATEPPAREEEVTVRPLALVLIRRDGQTQSRQEMNADIIREYAEDMRAGVAFPPIKVYRDEAGEYWLADGFHRYHAAVAADLHDLRAEIRRGDVRAARLHAAGANNEHGLRRTNADKRNSVLMLLNDAEWAQWSDREISRQCAVSQPFVSKVRAELSDNGYQIGERTVERGGQTYTMNTAQIGQRATPESMARAAQDAQARQVDRATGEIVDLVDETQEAALASAPDWLTATVLVNADGLLCGVILKVGSQQFNAFYLPRPDRPWDQFATHQQAVEFLESKVR